ALAVADLDRPTPIRDEAGGLQRLRGDRHLRAPGAEHRREELLGEHEAVAIDAVVRHEQPPRRSPYQRMTAIAARHLRHLIHHLLDGRQEDLARGRVTRELDERERWNAEGGAR